MGLHGGVAVILALSPHSKTTHTMITINPSSFYFDLIRAKWSKPFSIVSEVGKDL